MAVEHLKSASITNLDAAPVVSNTAGKGAPGRINHVGDYATVSAAASVLSTYQLARFPSNAKIKSVIFESEAQGAGKVQLGLYYSDSTNDGTPAANQGTVVSGAVAFFASDIDCSAAVNRAGYTNNGGSYTLDKRNKAIWDAAGLSVDPGGFFDLVATVHTTAITTGTGKIGGEVEYIE